MVLGQEFFVGNGWVGGEAAHRAGWWMVVATAMYVQVSPSVYGGGR